MMSKSIDEMFAEQQVNELKARENLWNILYEVASEFRLNLRNVRETQNLNNEALQLVFIQLENLQRMMERKKDD